MDDYKVIIYIVLGAIYYGYKFLSKKKEESEQTPKRGKPLSVPTNPYPTQSEWSTAPPKEPKRPTSFQDLLQEVKKEKEERQKPVHRPFYEVPEIINYESPDYKTNPEKAVIESVNPYLAYHTLDVEKVSTNTSARFKEFATGPVPKHPIIKALKEKNKIREAFMLSEVLKRN